jgi:hypothetical protein
MTVSSPAPTSRRSFSLAFPSFGISIPLRGGYGSEMNFFKSSCKAQDFSKSTSSNDYSTKGVRLLTSLGGRAVEYS